MEAGKLRVAQETMEDMAHFVEECDHVVVSHQGRLIRGGFRQVCHHGGERITALAIREVMARKKGPDGRMRVFGS